MYIRLMDLEMSSLIPRKWNCYRKYVENHTTDDPWDDILQLDMIEMWDWNVNGPVMNDSNAAD